MASFNKDLYEALVSVGVDDSKARAAAGEKTSVDRLAGELRGALWAGGVVAALIVALLAVVVDAQLDMAGDLASLQETVAAQRDDLSTFGEDVAVQRDDLSALSDDVASLRGDQERMLTLLEQLVERRPQ